jgi:hypothetical protein
MVAIVIGLILAFDLPKRIRIDKCLDRGGRYDCEHDVCIDADGERPSIKDDAGREQR